MKKLTALLKEPFVLLALGAVIGAVAIAAVEDKEQPVRKLDYQPVQTPVANRSSASDGVVLGELNDQYVKLSDYVSAAVVHISITMQVPGRGAAQSMGDGSGFIMSSDGWIVTNQHVVNGKKSVDVVLSDGREFKGKVYETGDRDLDIALVKIDANDLPTLKFADSDEVKPGQIVVAAGSPFGLENSITFGHVSAISRPGLAGDGRGDSRVYRGMIQTDASINPGNSGGPLVNIEGEVLGMNTSILSTSGVSGGIGFAIPSNMVRVIADELIKTGKFDRGMMGLAPRDLKPYEAKELNLQGAYVELVSPGDPAEKGGIEVGDVITKIGDTLITNETDLRVSMIAHSPNDKVDVVFVRKGETKTTSIVLIAPTFEDRTTRIPNIRPQETPFGQTPPNFRDFFREERPSVGVTLFDVDETTRKQYGFPVGLEGAVIESVRRGSIAESAGLKQGDVITKINGTTVKTGQDFVEGLNEVKVGDSFRLTYVRMVDGKPIERTLTIAFE